MILNMFIKKWRPVNEILALQLPRFQYLTDENLGFPAGRSVSNCYCSIAKISIKMILYKKINNNLKYSKNCNKYIFLIVNGYFFNNKIAKLIFRPTRSEIAVPSI